MSHTKGRWVTTADGTNVKSVELDLMICGTSRECSQEERLANARLIADAPELLAALKEINNVALGHPYAGCTCGDIARAAIAKLDGKQ